MLVKQLCQTYLKKSLSIMHSKRRKSLADACWSLMNNGKLGLTYLGRNMDGESKVKHKIKKVDRLLGNTHLHKEIPEIYQNMVKIISKSLSLLHIFVDWSGCCSDKFFLLRASLMYDGRSIPLYNEVHLKQNNSKIENDFLDNLKKIIPHNKNVIIITDAGFKTPWFRKVLSLDWDYIGRIRCMNIKLSNENSWFPVKNLSEISTHRLRYLGLGKLTKTASLDSNIYLYNEKLKGRTGQSRYPDVNKQYSALYRDPWVLVTSLSGGIKIGRYVKNVYKKRMQIEQNFRDDKNTRNGFSWRLSGSKSIGRISVLCLIAMIASFLLLCIGKTAERFGLHYQFQANSIKSHRVLSLIYLGKQLILSGYNSIDYKSIKDTLMVQNNHYLGAKL